jgi:hypothetical protein
MSKQLLRRTPFLKRALEDQHFPEIELALAESMDSAIDDIVDMDIPERLVAALLERRTPHIAQGVLRLLQRAPETFSVCLLNQTVDMTTLAFHSSDAKDFFEEECGATLYRELSKFRSTPSSGSTRDFLTRLLYRTLFQKAPESKQWIRENFLSFDPLDEASRGQSFGKFDAGMLVILNYIGLDNQMIRERSREVLDVQIHQGGVPDHQWALLLWGQPEFDLEYLARTATALNNSVSTFVAERKKGDTIIERLGDALVENAQVDQVERIRQCMKAIAGMDAPSLAERSGGDLLLDFASHARGDSSARMAKLLQRNILTAEQVGPRLNSTKDLNFALRHGNLSMVDLLTHAPETLRAARLEHDLGL